MDSEKRGNPRSFEERLEILGCTIEKITKWPSDLSVKEDLLEYTPQVKISIPEINGVYIIFNREADERSVAYKYGGQLFLDNDQLEGISHGATIEEVKEKALPHIIANIKGERNQKEGRGDLNSIIEKLEGNKTIITEFPDDLDSSDGDTTGYLVKERDFRSAYQTSRRQIFRIDFANNVTVLMYEPQGKEYYAGLYKNGKYDGGNHDFKAAELEGNISRLIAQ